MIKNVAIGLFLAGNLILCADDFIEPTPKQKNDLLSPLDRKIMEMKKGINNSNVGFYVDAKRGVILGSSIVGVPKIDYKSQSINTKNKNNTKNIPQAKKNTIEYNMQVEKIDLLQGN